MSAILNYIQSHPHRMGRGYETLGELLSACLQDTQRNYCIVVTGIPHSISFIKMVKEHLKTAGVDPRSASEILNGSNTAMLNGNKLYFVPFNYPPDKVFGSIFDGVFFAE